MNGRVALCSHFAVEHFRGGEKWVVDVANRLAVDGIDVDVRSLPYAPDGQRRVDADDVLDGAVGYTEGWRHDVSGYDTAYTMYTPGMRLAFRAGSDTRTVAGIHSWAFVTDRLFESQYGVVPTAAKLCHRAVGPRDLRGYDAVHTVTPAFDSPHPETTYVPNFVDTTRFRPDRRELADDFTVLVTAAHIPEKGWDVVRSVADRLPPAVRLAATGRSVDTMTDDATTAAAASRWVGPVGAPAENRLAAAERTHSHRPTIDVVVDPATHTETAHS